MDNFFKDLKIVELASVLAGPAVGMFFSELGAKVTKIENKTTGGDVTRLWRLPNESKETPRSAYYCSVNWQKEVLMLNLKDQEDLEKALSLIKEADIVLSNYKMTSAEKMGVSYKQLKAINSGLIYAHLTSFGSEEDRPAFDVVLQAEAGFLHMCGEPGGNPVKMPVALIDLLAAHQMKEGILLALLRKAKTGQGALVTTSLLEAAIASLANQATNWLMAGHLPQKMGTMHPNIAPYGDVFLTKDAKPIILAVGTQKQFKTLCELVGLPEVMDDNRFKTNHLRVDNRLELKKVLTPQIALFNRPELMTLFQQNGVPAGSIRNMREVFEQPQAQAMILEEQLENQTNSKCVKTVAFQIQ